MTYEKYIRHLQQNCPKARKMCPFECNDNQHFEKYELRDHLMQQKCQEYFAKCIYCAQNVRIKDRMSHQCVLEQLYSRVKQKIINLQVAQQICRRCHTEMLGTVKCKIDQNRFILSDELCKKCNESGIVQRFESWK